jgi:hypothetical protein
LELPVKQQNKLLFLFYGVSVIYQQFVDILRDDYRANLKFAEKKSEVKFITFVVRKNRINRQTEVNYRANRAHKPKMRIRPLSVKLRDTE